MQSKFVRGIRYVPTLPVVLSRILATLNDERSSAKDLETIIQSDQALTSKILAVANSAYYGFRHRILTVGRATVALGYDEVRNICLGASLMAFLHPSTFKDQTAAELLWLHSLTVAEAAQLLDKQITGDEGGPAFTCGLLHDIGKVVLEAFFYEDVQAMLSLMDQEGMGYLAAEKAMELEHAKVGASLAEHWDLPPLLAETIGYHHEFHAGLTYLPKVCVIHLADYLAHKVGLGHSRNSDPAQIKPRSLDILGLSPGELQECFNRLSARRLAVVDLWKTLVKS